MSTEAVSCNHCGAPLRVGAGARFATCNHCGSHLEIHRGDSAAWTEVLDELREVQAGMAEDLEAIRLQNELERIDREWEQEAAGYRTRDSDGHSQPPATSPVLPVVVGAIAAAFGIAWTIGASSMGAPGIFTAFGVVFVLVAIVSAVHAAGKSTAYRTASARHRQRRERVLRQLRERGSAHD
ncbi:MAG: zinc ribbon domain-containing protein [Planctomycetes bacterium]|nr:zinc ribbon domain-containing protein [Planctomycetota bacterium]